MGGVYTDFAPNISIPISAPLALPQSMFDDDHQHALRVQALEFLVDGRWSDVLRVSFYSKVLPFWTWIN